MKKEIKAKWIAALRSGEYKQGHGRLLSINNKDEQCFCCLGVLCDLYIKETNNGSWLPSDYNEKVEGQKSRIFTSGDDWDRDGSLLPRSVMDWADLYKADPLVFVIKDREGEIHPNPLYKPLSYGDDYIQRHLSGLNDDGNSFELIANCIEVDETL